MKLVPHFPSSLALLDASAVAYTYLKEVTLPEGLLYIQPNVFLKCNNLKKLVCQNVMRFLECACYLRENLEEPSSTRWTSTRSRAPKSSRRTGSWSTSSWAGTTSLRPELGKRG